MSLDFSFLKYEQPEAVKRITEWFRKKDKPYFTLGGYAGTGKTTVLPYALQNLKLDPSEMQVVSVAFTGKASLVMKRKGLPNCSTIHGLIYDVSEEEIKDSTGKVIGKRLISKRKESLDFRIKLILCDEASMINETIFTELLSYKIPVLLVGDCFQLPPIHGDFNIMDEKNLDFKLSTVQRQALDNPIIRLSMDIRNGHKINDGKYGDTVVKMPFSKVPTESILKADQILCAKNATRKLLNNEMREMLGYTGPHPKKGEKLIVVANNWEIGVVNGQHIYLVEDAEDADKITYDIAYTEETRSYVHRQWLSKRNFLEFNDMPCRFEMKERIQADFGYAITVHKSQGSEWDKVLFLEERIMRDRDLHQRFLYTAVTRASEKLIWCY